MTLVLGASAKVYASGWDLTSHFNGYSPEMSAELKDKTVFGKTFRCRQPTMRDGKLSLEGFFDGVADAAPDYLLSAIGGENKVWNVMPDGDTFGSVGYGMLANVSKVGTNQVTDDLVKLTADAESNCGIELVTSLRALAAATGTGNGATHNNSAATTYGASAYLQVMDFQGTDITISIRHSTDNFASDNTELLAFAQVTSDNQAERDEATGTVKQYSRILIAGTFTTVTFAVFLHRKTA